MVEWIMAGLVYQLQHSVRGNASPWPKILLHIDVAAPEISPSKISFFVFLSPGEVHLGEEY